MDEGHTERLDAALDGRYRIERKLGEGGMASVYLAEDIKHERRVALKILRPELAAVLGAERFLSEIKTTANLQHPHILPLFDSGQAEGYLYYVMPYIDGETLREKLDREKQLGVEEAVRIARDVADALDYAHRNDVIHRDIKPGNILLHDGRPVVADFGIALAVSAAGAGRMTETGLSLGTPHYMSPEQASADRDLSARSDVYSLGCVLYEMIAGQPPHTGPSAQSVLVRILTESPRPLTELRHTVPPHVAATVAKSIEKLPADRFDSARAVLEALEDEAFSYQQRPRAAEEAAAAPAPAAVIAPPWHRDRRLVASLGVGAVLAALAAWGWLGPNPSPASGVATRAAVTDFGAPPTNGGWRVAISPDGRSLLKVVDGSIHIRPASDPEWRQLLNTEGGQSPTFSPDGRSVAFSANGDGIWKVSIDGGPALPVAPSGGDDPYWGRDDTIVYVEDGRLYRVSSSGGDPDVLLDSDSLSAFRPQLLPNARAVVFGTAGRANGASSRSRILLLEIETGEVRELVASGNQPRYVPTGHLVYGHAGDALMGVPFDLEALDVTGPPVTLLPSLTVFGGGAVQFGVSDNGTLIYAARDRPGSFAGPSPLTWVGLEGAETPLPLTQEPVGRPRISSDGRRIAYESEGQIWVYTIATGTNTQLTFEGQSAYPTWSRDGLSVYFLSVRPGTDGPDGFRKAADGASPAEQLWQWQGGESGITSIAPDESWLVVGEVNDDTARDVTLASLGSDSVTFRQYLRADWGEYEGTISPNGRWMAYTSNELGGSDVFVRGFPEPTGQWRISEGPSFDPLWAPDGSALYYAAPPNFMKVDVSTEGTFSFGQPTVLFTWAFDGGGGLTTGYDVHPDGDRFLFVRGGGGGAFGDVYIVTNWFEELLERMGS